MSKRDYYEVLGVSRNATADEIRRAHRKLVRQYHPDANKNNPQAEAKFKEVQEAYDVLSDKEKRARYDQFGHAGVGAAPGGGPSGADPFEAFRRAGGRGGRAYTRPGGPQVSVEDFDFGEIFDQLFGARSTQHRARGPQVPPERGADVEHTVELSFEEAARGRSIPLQINRDGQVETIEVKIPPGVKDGSRVRLRGRGQQSPSGAGDLYIITRVRPHPIFRREDQDIYVDVPISLYEAINGAKVEVPTLDGPVTVTIPPGTSGGAKLRIRGRGIERNGQRGDQFVTPRIIIPKDLDDQDRKAIEAIARKHPLNARSNWP